MKLLEEEIYQEIRRTVADCSLAEPDFLAIVSSIIKSDAGRPEKGRRCCKASSCAGGVGDA